MSFVSVAVPVLCFGSLAIGVSEGFYRAIKANKDQAEQGKDPDFARITSPLIRGVVGVFVIAAAGGIIDAAINETESTLPFTSRVSNNLSIVQP